MEINVVELIVQAGGLGLAALLVIVAARYGGKYLADLISRLMDNLDQQNANYQASIQVQAEMAAALSMLHAQVDDLDESQAQRAQELASAMAQVASCVERQGKMLQAHEGRMEKRLEQQMRQAEERHQELIGVLQGLNGK